MRGPTGAKTPRATSRAAHKPRPKPKPKAPAGVLAKARPVAVSPPLRKPDFAHYVWQRPVFTAGLFFRGLEKRLKRDGRAAGALIDKLDWQTRLALLAFAASALGLAHAYIYFARLGLNIVEYASITDYPVFAIKGLWWVILSVLVVVAAYAVPSLAVDFFASRRRRMVEARWWRRHDRLTADACEAILKAHRKRNWLTRLQDGFTTTYAAVMALYVIGASVLALGLSAYVEADRVAALRPDSERLRTFPSGLFYRDNVCVRLSDGKYVNRLGHPASADCQASAVPLGATSAWLIFKFGEGVKVVKRDDVSAVESVSPVLRDKLLRLDLCRKREQKAYDARQDAVVAAIAAHREPPAFPHPTDNCQWPEAPSADRPGGAPARDEGVTSTQDAKN